MIVLNGHSLTPARRLPLESMSLKLKERESAADIIPADLTGISTQTWLQDDTEPGKGIVWRVVKIQQAYADSTPTVTLEHAIRTLNDRILFGEIKPDTIKGVVGATTCTAREAITYILAQQSDWVLGTFGYGTVTNAYKFDGDTLLDALQKVSETLDECWWSYDFTTYPFKLNITPKPAGVACELRPGRNLVSVTKTIDRSGMYTRHYPIGKADLHISGDYVSKNESLYGVSSKVEVDQSLETEAELRAWSNQRLKKHAEPVVTVTADGLELAEATGESLDKLRLGRLCRIPLQEFGTVIEERIVELNYRDKVGEPENVRITLANNHDDVVKIIAEEIKTGGGRGGGGARGSARDRKEDLAWFEDTNSHVAMVAKGIVGVNAQGDPNWIRLSQIIVDENGIDSSVQSVQQDVDDVNTWKTTAESRITQTESSISQVVTAIGSNDQVTAASIILAINNDSSSVKISADEIDINGIINGMRSTTLDVGTLLAIGVDVAGTLTATDVDTSSVETDALEVNGCDMRVSNITKNTAGDTITVSFVDGTSWDFSKAASTQVTLSGEWSGTVTAGKSYKVTATPGGTTHYSPALDGMAQNASSKSWASDYKSFNQEISVYDENSEDLYKETLTFSTTPSWNAGHTQGGTDAGLTVDAENGQVVRAANNSTKRVTITADYTTPTYNSSTHKYSFSAQAKAGSDILNARSGSTGTEAYDAGVIAGQGGTYTALTGREVLGSGGTTYYQAGSSVPIQGSKVSVTKQGTSVTARPVLTTGGTTYYTTANGKRLYHLGTYGLYELDDGVYRSVGSHDWYYVNTSSGTYYYTRANELHLGASGTYYNAGSKADYYNASSQSATAIDATTAIHLKAEETLYRKS